MPSILIPDMIAALTGNGTANGYVTIASNAGWYPGQTVNLYSAGAGSAECIITDLVSTNQIGLRKKPQTAAAGSGPNYGRSDVSAWTTAGAATLNAERQVVRVQDEYSNKTTLL